MSEKLGAEFLHKQDSRLHTTKEVEHEKTRRELSKKETSHSPADKLADWMQVLERTHLGHREDPRVLERIKRSYYKQYVIKPEDVPEGYFETQQRIAREQGHGDVEITDEMREQAIDVIITDQKSTLDNWLDYFTSPDSDSFPMWAKYWAFTGMAGLSKFDKETKTFSKRSKDTVAPFPDLNREALAYAVDYMVKRYGEEFFNATEQIADTERKLKKFERYEKQKQLVETGKDANGREVPDRVLENIKKNLKEPEGYTNAEDLQEELVSLRKKQEDILGTQNLSSEDKEVLSTENFGKLYAHAIEKVTPTEQNLLQNTEGVWVKFPQGTDPTTYIPEGFDRPLVQSLQGHGTGWCTAGESTAKSQLEDGDFYVYYSKDAEGNPTIPRSAIRMEEDHIAEVRGIAREQNLDPYIGGVVEEKMQDFGKEGESYKKKAEDMKRLTEIERKHHVGEELSKEELVFLYEIDEKIEGFGYEEDPRIQELLSERDSKVDASIVFDCAPSEIAWGQDEVTEDTKAYVGPLFPGIFKTLGHLECLYTSFPEGGIRRDAVMIGEKTIEQLERELAAAGMNTSYSTKHSLKQVTPQETTEQVELVRLTIEDLGFRDRARVSEIYQKAEELGLELCPAEVAPAYRLQYTEQPTGESFFIAMKQVTDRRGDKGVFRLSNSRGLRLDFVRAHSYDRWRPEIALVFRLRK